MHRTHALLGCGVLPPPCNVLCLLSLPHRIQVLLHIAVQHQLCVGGRIVVDQVIQLPAIKPGLHEFPLHGEGVDGDHCPVRLLHSTQAVSMLYSHFPYFFMDISPSNRNPCYVFHRLLMPVHDPIFTLKHGLFRESYGTHVLQEKGTIRNPILFKKRSHLFLISAYLRISASYSSSFSWEPLIRLYSRMARMSFQQSYP